jgi:very-long-chain enoyl-CoA reductase
MLASFLPPLTPLNAGVTAAQLVAVSAGLTERSAPVAYSKFAAGAGNISSRLGMVIIYSLGLAASAALLVGELRESARPRAVLVGAMLMAHYLKRELEVLYIHVYSGKTSLAVASFISLSYGLTALGITHYTARDLELGPGAMVGLVIFVIGLAGNGWHHWLLSTLRSGGTKKYVIPTCGLFPLVSCPHYLFELVAWLGIAIASHSLFACLQLAQMTSYLTSRASATTNWYQSKFGSDYPATRRHIIPFLY